MSCGRIITVRGLLMGVDMMRDLTAFQRDVLRVVDGLESPNGLEVKAELEAYYGEEVHHGRLYPNLDTLVTHGLVDKGKKDERTNLYEMTKKGQQVLTDRDCWNTAHRLASDEEMGEKPTANAD